MTETAEILDVCISKEKGTRKKPIPSGRLVQEHGLEGDAHAGTPKRQVSLLCESSIQKMRDAGADIGPGDFAENLILRGCHSTDFGPGVRIKLARGPVLEVTQMGKECHSGCEIARITGDCIMPREGIFARVVRGGTVEAGDTVEIIQNEN